MLETRDLFKKYKPKKGKEVVAVDRISLKFPEKGMVFLLGKSGSGKSTMLNLLGGLDSYDDGEIIIKGISSKDFDQQRFDSYRNTYVGFIFQEYNVLEDFNVGANIALALELQGKKAGDEEINRILKEVDLDGFGERNPNELSGGQKQRVAIARALVKNPEIIMADEPTGALDSVTGRQVLDTLKKLSSDKLVVVVSHDREYAEQYADRIIELADGKVIRDVEVNENAAEEKESLDFDGANIAVPAGYHLTEDDRHKINEYIDRLGSGLTISVTEKGSRFRETDESKIPVQDGKDFALIKSILPMKSAFTIGKSSLKHKKFRLVMTILLSVVAFSLFAFVDTFSSYDHIRSCVDSLRDSEIGYVSISKTVKEEKDGDVWWNTVKDGITDDDLKNIESDTGVAATGIFKPKRMGLSFGMNLGDNAEDDEKSGISLTSSYLTGFCGFAEITEETLENMGYSVYAGKLPDPSKDEIAISCLAAESFIRSGYVSAQPVKDYADDSDFSASSLMDQFSQLNLGIDPAMLGQAQEMGIATDADALMEKKKKAEKFSDPVYMVGKSLLLDNKLYTVTAVIDTKFDSARYKLLDKEMEKLTNTETILQFILSSEYQCAVNKSLTGAAMVGEGAVERLVADEPVAFESSKGNLSIGYYGNQGMVHVYSRYYSRLSDVPADNIIWADKPLGELKDNEIIVSAKSVSATYNDIDKKFVGEDGTVTKKTLEDMNKFIASAGKLTGHVWEARDFEGDGPNEISDIKIVGCFTSESSYDSANVMVVSDDILEKIADVNDGIYDCAVGCMPETKAGREKIVSYCYSEEDGVTERYAMNNAVVYELDSLHMIIKGAAKVFFWVGLFFAVFASILMANFISTSISYKKQEIGILRAIGSRSNDVFRIFFSESFIIAIIEFVITAILCFAAVCLLNWFVRHNTGILITFLHFGIRQVIIILVISLAVAALASFFPVRNTASKKPIDAIRGR